MNEQNISQLKTGFQSIGFEDGLEYLLRCTICYQPEHFIIRRKVMKGKDMLHFQFYLERGKDTNEYACRYYDVVLRKEIMIPDVVIEGENLIELDQKLEAINWHIGSSDDDITPSLKEPYDWEREKAIEEVVITLARMENTEEGKQFADRLKMKHWADTPAEKWIGGFHTVKNRFELGQRFYFFTEQENITIEEAYRFLNNKWLEKRWHTRKKLNGKDDWKGALEGKEVAVVKKPVKQNGKRK